MSSIDTILSKGDVASGERSRERAHKLLNDFKEQLKLPSKSNINIDRALENFLIEAVLGAAWYQVKSKRALRWLWLYIIINIILVIALPLGLIGLAKLGTGMAVIPAQITGVLTGILALQKTLSQWYVSQQRYAAWYKARSDLKTVYYGLVHQWSGKIAAVDQFLVALDGATEQSRKVIDDEQLDYFQRLALPSFDVLDMLTSTRAGVSGFVTALLPGSALAPVTAVGRTSFTGPPSAPALTTGGTGSGPPGSEVALAVPDPLFRHSLHSPITTDPEQIATLNAAFSRALAIRSSALAAPAVASGVRVAVPAVPAVAPSSVEIAMLTATAASYFDSYLFVRFKGGQLVQLLVDSGNTCLIMPCLDDLQSLPNFRDDYKVLASSDGAGPLTEPWGQAAVLVKGPIEIDTGKGDGSVVTIPDCVFYVCKSSRDQGTANFGLGVIATWQQVAGEEVRSPLAYNTGYNFVEIDLADAPAGVGGGTSVTEDSRLRLYKAKPSGYRMMKIISNNNEYKSNNLPWMALRPLSLSIDGKATGWPSGPDAPIAMIDTGGTQPYLSDPSGKTYTAMSTSAGGTLPDWVSDPGTPSTMCSATSSVIGVELGDDTSSYAYAIDLSTLPATDRATSLVVCTNCGYMRDQPGINIGGLSMLFNSLLIDISSKTVGLMKKPQLDLEA
jgi:hypothetical protein